MSLTSTIKDAARALGFDAVGVALVPAGPFTAQPDSPDFLARFQFRLTSWLAAGYHATMAWMGRDPDRRADPRLVLPGCRSVIVVGMNYDAGERPDEGIGMGRIARYAWGRDYHEVLSERLAALTLQLATLAPEGRYKWYVDTGPVMEKGWAQQAGLGWIGKHSNLVSSQYGSWLVLGELLTTLDLEPDVPGSDLCGTCSLCIKACPTGAIVEPYVVDARRCISYLTIEHRDDDIPQDLAHRMGNHIFGCDDCLDVCPYNGPAPSTGQADFRPRPWTLKPFLIEMLSWTEQKFLSMTQGSPIRRAKYAGLRRNLGLAQRNADRQAAFKQAGPPSP